MKICHVKIANGAVDARKWSATWRNWNIFDIFFSLRSIEGRKQRRRAETFVSYMRTVPPERARQENWFSRFDISDTPRSGRSSRFDEDRLNTLIHNDPHQCTREVET